MTQITEASQQPTDLDSAQRDARVIEEFIKLVATSHSTLSTPSIVATPGVCGGVPRIIRTRIPVWTLERMRQLGVSEADILHSYPTLKAVDLVQAWAYVDAHREVIDQQIRENEED
jgi:uncharacterized protein (DUF433 family)